MIDTTHTGRQQTLTLGRYLEQFGGIPEEEDAPSDFQFKWLAAQGALAQSRLADALERLEKDSWLAIANKLAEIQAKISLLEKEVSTAAQAFVDSNSQLHFKFMELDGNLSAGLNATDMIVAELRADIDTLLGRGAGEQSETPDPFFVDIEEDDVRLSVE